VGSIGMYRRLKELIWDVMHPHNFTSIFMSTPAMGSK
jgi:hypothetical protein